MQAFNWESHHQGWYHRLMEQANWFASLGITVVWIPPFTDSVSPQGYMPLDLYNLNSRYGSQDELRRWLLPSRLPDTTTLEGTSHSRTSAVLAMPAHI